MEQKENNKSPSITCKRCGRCCLTAYVPATEEDMERWRREGKQEIFRIMEHSKSVWAGDIVISSENGKTLSTCPFLQWEGTYYTCTIYEDRPKVCREYKPGSSELCPQYKKPG
jgi:Fe-S-cluster containining protein